MTKKIIPENADRIVNENMVDFQFDNENSTYSNLGIDVDKEIIDKLAYNKIGILPYFPPTPKVSNDSGSESNSESAPGRDSEIEIEGINF